MVEIANSRARPFPRRISRGGRGGGFKEEEKERKKEKSRKWKGRENGGRRSFSRSRRLNTAGAKNFSGEERQRSWRNGGSKWRGTEEEQRSGEGGGGAFEEVQIRTNAASGERHTFQGKSCGGIKLKGL